MFEKSDSYIYIATERVVPLRWHVKRKSLSPETAKWGLYSIAVRPTKKPRRSETWKTADTR